MDPIQRSIDRWSARFTSLQLRSDYHNNCPTVAADRQDNLRAVRFSPAWIYRTMIYRIGSTAGHSHVIKGLSSWYAIHPAADKPCWASLRLDNLPYPYINLCAKEPAYAFLLSSAFAVINDDLYGNSLYTRVSLYLSQSGHVFDPFVLLVFFL